MLNDEEAKSPENIKDTLQFVSEMYKFVTIGRTVVANADSTSKEDIASYLTSALDIMEHIFGATQMLGETMAISEQIDLENKGEN